MELDKDMASEPRPLGEILREMAKRNNQLGRALRSALQCVTTNDRKEVKDGE